MTKISVIGAGAWGTALAQTIAQKKPVTLWARDPALAEEINTAHENKRYLPGIPLSHHINATTDLEIALKSTILLLVTPAQCLRDTLQAIKPNTRPEHTLILCAKGLEKGTGLIQSQIAQEILPETSFAILSGPNFAKDIAQGKPAATTLACTDKELAKTLQESIATPLFRPYITQDIIGTQIAGALKNVIAIACGIAHGLDMGESARASLVTRGLAEISRLGIEMGALQDTFLGLSGVGDMMLTCSSKQSRNFSLGYALGKGEKLEDILKNRKSVTEGIHTAESAVNLAQKYAVDMPICTAIHQCINELRPLDEALKDMLNRPLGHE